MANTVTPGTFIPRDTVTQARPRAHQSGLNDLILLCSIVLLVASGALGVGVFLYNQLLVTESASKVAQLQRAQAAFEPSLIQQLTRLDDRMHAADTVLGAHVAPTAFFAALGAATLQTVSFQSLDYEEGDSQHLTIKMQGIAQSVNSIALQADLFSKNGVITSPIFSNISRQPDGVHFDLSAILNPSTLNYSTLIAGALSQASASTGSGAQSPAAPSSPFGGAQDVQNAPAAPTNNATTTPAPQGTPAP